MGDTLGEKSGWGVDRNDGNSSSGGLSMPGQVGESKGKKAVIEVLASEENYDSLVYSQKMPDLKKGCRNYEIQSFKEVALDVSKDQILITKNEGQATLFKYSFEKGLKIDENTVKAKWGKKTGILT